MALLTCAEVAPWWVYFLNGFTGLVYLHLDCVDGKQARRTKSSSPLGQLFDHGILNPDQPTMHALVVKAGHHKIEDSHSGHLGGQR